MSEVQKLIISRKKIDPHGNIYALLKISSNLYKNQEKRIIKFNTPKISKQKKEDKEERERPYTTRRTDSSRYRKKPKNLKISKSSYLTKKENIKSKRSDSATAKSSKFTSFISTFNTPSKGKNSFICNSPKPYINLKNYNSRYHNSNNLKNYLYFPNSSKNNSEFFKTQYLYSYNQRENEFLKKKENLNKKIIILSRKNNECFDKINNLKKKESKLYNIKINKLKDKEEIDKCNKNKKNEFELKKHLLSEIKEINKCKRQAIEEIKSKEKKIRINNIKYENSKIKNIIKKTQIINYQKNREYYLKIKKEEENMKRKRLKKNLSRKKKDKNKENEKMNKEIIKTENKELEELKKKYEKLKLINNEYNLFIKHIKNKQFSKTFTPKEFIKFSKYHLSFNKINTLPKKITVNENYLLKSLKKKKRKEKTYKYNSIHLG